MDPKPARHSLFCQRREHLLPRAVTLGPELVTQRIEHSGIGRLARLRR